MQYEFRQFLLFRYCYANVCKWKYGEIYVMMWQHTYPVASEWTKSIGEKMTEKKKEEKNTKMMNANNGPSKAFEQMERMNCMRAYTSAITKNASL